MSDAIWTRKLSLNFNGISFFESEENKTEILTNAFSNASFESEDSTFWKESLLRRSQHQTQIQWWRGRCKLTLWRVHRPYQIAPLWALFWLRKCRAHCCLFAQSLLKTISFCFDLRPRNFAWFWNAWIYRKTENFRRIEMNQQVEARTRWLRRLYLLTNSFSNEYAPIT